jgi:hypothetical protein
MITHEPGASAPNFVAEILLALDELQEQVDQAGGLPYYAKAQMDEPRRSSDRACVVMHDGRMEIRTLRATSEEELGAALNGATLLGVLTLRGEINTFRTKGLESVEDLRSSWIEWLSGETPFTAAYLLSTGLMTAQVDYESLGVSPAIIARSMRIIYKDLAHGDRRIPLMVDACLKLLQPMAGLTRSELRERAAELWNAEALTVASLAHMLEKADQLGFGTDETRRLSKLD